jgi:hypothetical protein
MNALRQAKCKNNKILESSKKEVGSMEQGDERREGRREIQPVIRGAEILIDPALHNDNFANSLTV